MSIRKSVDIIRVLESGEEIKVCKKSHLQFPLYCKTQEATLSAVEKNSQYELEWEEM
jgi:hypothetical protein